MPDTITITIPVHGVLLAVLALVALGYLAYSVAGIRHDLESLPSEFALWRREGKMYPFARHLRRFRPGWRWMFLPAIVASYWISREVAERSGGDGQR